MSLAIEFSRARIGAPQRPARPIAPSVNWLNVRGLRAEERADAGRARKPQPAIGMGRRDQTPQRFLDDRGKIVSLDKNSVENLPKPDDDVIDQFEQIKRKRRTVWVHKVSGVLWRPEKRKIRDARSTHSAKLGADADTGRSISLSAGVGEIISHWVIDFSDPEIHPELNIIPNGRQCRATDRDSGAFCCSSRADDGSAYCSMHRLRYTRRPPPR